MMNNFVEMFDKAKAENNQEALKEFYSALNDLIEKSFSQVKQTFPDENMKTPAPFTIWEHLTRPEQWEELTEEQRETIKTEIVRRYPDTLLIPNTKLENMLFSENVELFNNSIQPLIVDDNKTEIEAGILPQFYLDETGKNNITGLGVMADNPAFCNSVFGHLCSIIKKNINEDNRTFKETPFVTTSEIYNMMNRGKTKAPVRMKELIDKVLTCLDTTYLYCNYTEQAKKWGLPSDQGEYIRRETILSLVKDSKVVNGQKVDGYFIRNVPFLLEYTLNTKQYCTIPIQQIPAISRVNEYKINIRYYLMKEIHTAHTQTDLAYTDRLYTTIFSNSSIRTKHKTQLERYKDFIATELLPQLKENGTIKDFEELASGKVRANGRDKIRIYLNRKRK